jgi:hypothetical protein
MIKDYLPLKGVYFNNNLLLFPPLGERGLKQIIYNVGKYFMKLSIYDFDETLYDGDCFLDFYLFCLKSKPWKIIYFPYQVTAFIFWKLKIISTRSFKKAFMIFINNRLNKIDRTILSH